MIALRRILLVDGESDRARIARVILVAGAVVTATTLTASLLLRPLPAGAITTQASMVLAHLAALRILHYGWTRSAVITFTSVYLLSVIYAVWSFGGLHVPAMLTLPPLVLFVGLTWSGKAAFVTATIAAVSTFLVAGLEHVGWLAGSMPVPAVRVAVITTGVLFITAFMLWVALSIVARSREEAAASLAERRRLEGHLTQARRLESVGRLAAGVAHDFNNLLTVIYGEADRIEQGQGDNATSAANILAAAERASALTRQLLAFGRKQVIEPELLDLSEVVSKLAPLLRGLLGKQAELAVTLASGLPSVRAGRVEIEQILLNLVTNARDAMGGGGTVTVCTGSATADQLERCEAPMSHARASIYLSVHDLGAGMDPETRERLFEPFFTTKELGRGTGLGLATVHAIVHRLGGTILVDSQPGQGSTFTLIFPVSEASARASAPTLVAPRDAPKSWIVVVDDDPLVRETVVEMLRRDGHAVVAADGAAEALSMAAQWSRPPDLLLTDVLMPDMHGPELVQRLRRRFPTLKAMFMSGYAEERLSRRGILLDDVHFIAKPIESDTLHRKIACALASSELGSAGETQPATP